uniref:Uncharacterized protein n=1 Tax=Ditylum brightwellii TaxID=49249 RepID=A0A7S1W019_9STRA|mmetsp:Transcript_12057/g.17994  ORF Transcript_12057/g.17994 Transcript_12057/m.17994 type:complete len:493 (+) Transcript_12057:155-1633(+)
MASSPSSSSPSSSSRPSKKVKPNQDKNDILLTKSKGKDENKINEYGGWCIQKTISTSENGNNLNQSDDEIQRVVWDEEKLTPEIFFRDYVSKRRPVVLIPPKASSSSSSPKSTSTIPTSFPYLKWTPQYLKEKAGDAMVTVEQREHHDDDDDDDNSDVDLLNRDNENKDKQNNEFLSSFRKRNNTNKKGKEQKELNNYIERRTGGTLEPMPIRASFAENKNILEGLKEGITNVAASIVAPELYPPDIIDQLGGDDKQGIYQFVSRVADDSGDNDFGQCDGNKSEIAKLHDKVKELEKVLEEKDAEVRKWKGRVQYLEEALRLAHNGQKDSVMNDDEAASLARPLPSLDNKIASLIAVEGKNMEDKNNHCETIDFGDVFLVNSTEHTVNEGQLIDLSSPSEENTFSNSIMESEVKESHTAIVTVNGSGVDIAEEGGEDTNNGKEESTMLGMSSNRVNSIKNSDVFHIHQNGDIDGDSDVIIVNAEQEFIPLSL